MEATVLEFGDSIGKWSVGSVLWEGFFASKLLGTWSGNRWLVGCGSSCMYSGLHAQG